MSTSQTSITEGVVRNHLRLFIEQKGIPAMLDDYAEDAKFFSETKVYEGKEEIREFFVNFMNSLPVGAVENFALRSLRADGNLAYITWDVGTSIPLGVDTFIVDNAKIVSQTFAMHVRPAN